MRTYTVRQVADAVGVSVSTLQRWDRTGRLVPHRSPTGRRLYTEEQLMQLLGQRGRWPERRTVAYLRVSSQGQRPDLQNQRAALETFCTAQNIEVDEWVEEVGGGLNFRRRKFLKVLDDLETGRIERLVIAHKDRLCRFGFDLIEHISRRQAATILVMNNERLSPEREMVEDLMAITHCFSARLYGLRNYRKSLERALESDAQGTPDTAESDA